MVLVLGVAFVAALIVRHSGSRGELHTLAKVAGLALGARVAAIGVVFYIATRIHPEGVWLSDESSFFLATESLMPWPLDKALPRGLDHLGGDGWLGLTTAISLLFGGIVDAQAFRFANATFGTIVVLLCVWLGQSLFGRKAGLLAGLVAAVWPDLVLWSASMVRDTLGSLVVVAIWWLLVSSSRQRWLITGCGVVLGIVLLATLREYLAIAVGVGVVAWLAYPGLRRLHLRVLLVCALGIVALGAVLGVTQSRRIDAATHELLYRQVVTRMETLHRLYRDPPPADEPVQLPFRPGAAITLRDPNTGWLLPGLVDDSAQPGLVTVDLTDDTSRTVPLADLMLLQDAPIPPLQLLSWVLPSMLSVFVGLPTTSEPWSPVWIASALAWDALLLGAVVGLLRSRLGLRAWLYPACVILGTVAALSAIPGAPGNAERHRATQTVPMLLVFAAGAFASSRLRARAPAGEITTSVVSRPTSATTAVASVMRSER